MSDSVFEYYLRGIEHFLKKKVPLQYDFYCICLFRWWKSLKVFSEGVGKIRKLTTPP